MNISRSAVQQTPPRIRAESTLSIDRRRTDTVYAVIQEIVSNGLSRFQPGDVATFLRDQDQPMGTWEIRGEFSNLEAEGLIAVDPATAAWSLANEPTRKAG